jgi:hypothetical protein
MTPDIPRPIDYAKLAETLSERLDSHSTFQFDRFLEQGVDAHFIGLIIKPGGPAMLARASDYWKQVDYFTPYEGTFTLPKDLRTVAIYSRRAFRYPQVCANIKLPSLSLLGNETYFTYYFAGVEAGSAAYNGIASFTIETSTTYSNLLRVLVGPINGLTSPIIDIAKPSDFNTAYHTYRVIVSKNMVFFTIDSRLRAVAIQCLQGGSVKVRENVLPYSIALIPPIPSSITAFIEINTNRTATASADFIAPISPFRFRVNDGNEIVSMSLPLYLDNSDTTLAGYSISSGSVTSHPIPIFGYDKKTILFQANQAGTLQLQVYTLAGNWRTYDSVSVSANTLSKYILTGDAVLARIIFTPSTYPATVSDAEVILT